MISRGVVFYISGAAKEKARLPRLSLVLGTKSCCEIDDLTFLEYLKDVISQIATDSSYVHLLEETLKAVVPFYLVSKPGEVKDPTQGTEKKNSH